MTAIKPSVAVTAMLALMLAGMVHGQAYVQQGNVLDANPRVNSGGLNYGVRQYGGGLSNRIVTGNVAGGSSFRGFSPIRDPSSLFFTNYGQAPTANLSAINVQSGLPSNLLSPFDRSSVGVTTLTPGYIPGSLNRLPYYSLSGTVANTGAIVSGLNRPGSSQLISSYGPARPDMRLTAPNPLDTAGTQRGTLMGVQTQLVRVDNGQQLTGPVNQRLLSSRLFGAVREVSVDSVAAQAKQSGGGGLTATPGGRAGQPEANRRETGQQPERQPGLNALPENQSPAVSGLRTPSGAGALANTGDVYGLMRRASSGLVRGPAAAGSESPTIAQRGPKVGGPAGPSGSTSGLTEQELSGPIRTFVGTQASAVNQRLDEAETLLKQGQYYKASEAYAAAQAIDPSNPLPLLGRSVSLLAAGEYMSSANSLFTAIRLFESLSLFSVDMKSFVPDAAILASRQADIEKRLQVFDDFRLRFLLGYVQYSTGQTDTGLANMEAAAKKSPPELPAVGRFVTAIKERQANQSGPGSRPAR